MYATCDAPKRVAVVFVPMTGLELLRCMACRRRRIAVDARKGKRERESGDLYILFYVLASLPVLCIFQSSLPLCLFLTLSVSLRLSASCYTSLPRHATSPLNAQRLSLPPFWMPSTIFKSVTFDLFFCFYSRRPHKRFFVRYGVMWRPVALFNTFCTRTCSCHI